MRLKKTILFTFFQFLMLFGFCQEVNLRNIFDLKLSQKINHFHELIPHNNGALLLADARFENGDLDGFLIHFDLTGKILKEIRIGNLGTYERIVGISKFANGYYLLMNSVDTNKDGLSSLLLYQLDDNLSIISNETVEIERMNTANAMIYNPIKNRIEIVVSINDEEENTFPRLVHYELDNKAQSYLDFSSKNRPEKEEDLEVYGKVKNEDGTQTKQRISVEQLRANGFSRQVTHVIKECTNIEFTDDSCQELLLTGLENSSTITDFWVSKVQNNKIIWEDRFPTEVGGDEGRKSFKSKNGYLVFGHEYTKRIDSYYSYRTLQLSENGKEISSEKFDTGKKDWFKDVVQLGEELFLMFGQTQSVTIARSYSEPEKVNTSNLWAILVNSKGEFISDYLHKTGSIDEAIVMTKLDSKNGLIVFNSNNTLKIGQLILKNP